MAASSDRSIVRYESSLLSANFDCTGVFCIAPSVLEAINYVRRMRGLPTLFSHADGTIGIAEPLLLEAEFAQNPFFN